MTRIAGAVLAVALAALAAPPLRHALEASMALHMLVEFPLLLAAGWAAGMCWPRLFRVPACADAEGLSSALLLAATSAFWMLPVALDLALLGPGVAAAKFASWLAAGVALASGARRWRRELRLFLFFNLAWMTATAGLLYRESDSRLCVNYLAEQQLWAGNGLLALALLLGTWGVLSMRDAADAAPATEGA